MNAATTTADTQERLKQRRLNRAGHALVRALKQLQRNFRVDDDNRPAMDAVRHWLLQLPHPSYQVGQGLMITGPVGTGKTDMMSAIARVLAAEGREPLQVVNVKRVEKEFNRSDSGDKNSNGGDAVILRYASMSHVCFDDLAMEDDGKHYGRTANLMQDIIALRYERWRRGELITHFTTNATPEQLDKRYDKRTLSRLVEMCGQVYLGGPDRRRTSAAPNATRTMVGLFEDVDVPEPLSMEQAAEHFKAIRTTIAEAVGTIGTRKGVVLRIDGPTKEDEVAEIMERIPAMSDAELQRYVTMMEQEPNDWNAPVITALVQEQERRSEA